MNLSEITYFQLRSLLFPRTEHRLFAGFALFPSHLVVYNTEVHTKLYYVFSLVQIFRLLNDITTSWKIAFSTLGWFVYFH